MHTPPHIATHVTTATRAPRAPLAFFVKPLASLGTLFTPHPSLLVLALALCASASANAPLPASEIRKTVAQALATQTHAAAVPPLPIITPCYDAKAYAWVWDAPSQTWCLIPRNEARILHRQQDKDSGNKQLVGTLTIDGSYPVPAVSGANVILLFRKETNFKTYPGLPAGETGIEVTRLDIRDGYKKKQLIRTAQLHRLGESAATFGAKREPITVQKITRQDGIFHLVQVNRPLPPGRYALYLPDRAFEFEIK